MRFLTAGESHGKGLVLIVDGFPAGLKIDIKFLNKELRRRQLGYGRGGRMQIERDRVEIVAGVIDGKSTGAPIAIFIENKDHWSKFPAFWIPRPGHADFAGAVKYGFKNLRPILERASARETAARVAAGALAKLLLNTIGIRIVSYVKNIGGIEARVDSINALSLSKIDKSPVRCPDKKAEKKMVKLIDEAMQRGDSLGGIFEVVAFNVPIGLGSYSQWDRRLDARLAHAVMSIQGVKAVEIGAGVRYAGLWGSEAHDAFLLDKHSIRRASNNAGGIEGGISNGEPIIVRATHKPIATIKKRLASFNLKTMKPAPSHFERADVTAVPAAAVVAEAMVAWVLAEAILEKFGGDSVAELKKRVEEWRETRW